MGPWDSALRQLREWDAETTEILAKGSTNPWVNGILPSKEIELICIALNAASTNLQANGARRHIRAALAAGATREEILLVLEMAALLSIHSCSLGAPMLIEEAKAAGVRPTPKPAMATPACDKMRAIGQWNAAWDPFFQADPAWTEQLMAMGAAIYGGRLMTPRLVELLSIAFDASVTHMYAPGTRRHISGALKAGATFEEVMEVLKLCVAQGVEACNLGVPILAEELQRAERENGR